MIVNFSDWQLALVIGGHEACLLSGVGGGWGHGVGVGYLNWGK